MQHLSRARRGAPEGSLAHLLLDSAHALALAFRCLRRFRWSRACMACIGLVIVLLRARGAGPSNKVYSLRHRCVDLVVLLNALVFAAGTGTAVVQDNRDVNLTISFSVSAPLLLTTYGFPPPYSSPIRTIETVAQWEPFRLSLLVWDGLLFS